MRNLSTILLAVVMVFGLAQCKKEQPTPQSEGNVVTITLNVGDNNGSRVNVNPTGENHVTFTTGDQILVASGGKYVGTLTKDGETFSGTVSAGDLVVGQPLYFYFLGNKADVSQLTAGSSTTCTVNISDQTTEAGLPVISMGRSIDSEGRIVNYVSGMTSFSSRLYNKCSLMKFNVTTTSAAAICITGMNNKVTVNFGNPTDEGFTYGKDGEGVIKMHGVTTENTETWAIVLPQDELPAGVEGSVYTYDNAYIGTRPAIEGGIGMNQFLNSGLELAVNTKGYVDLGLPSRLLWATCNVGANAPEEYGDYFAWGETQTRTTSYEVVNYKYCKGSDVTLTKYCNVAMYGYNGFTDKLTTLQLSDDAARANWGGDWRMPTSEEWQELYNNTAVTWTQQGGVNGRLFTASNGNSLFLPAAGYRWRDELRDAGSNGRYWSKSLYTSGSPMHAWYFAVKSGDYKMDISGRYAGLSVRAVRPAPQN